jgi:hypothetical protein
MLKRNALYSLLLAVLIGLLAVSPAHAVPPLPSSFYGWVKVDGQNVPDGTLVRALVGGKAYAEGRTQTYEGDSVYSLNVLGDEAGSAEIEGGKEGETIQFEVGGVIAEQTGTWSSGTNVRLDLTVRGQEALATPGPTLTPLPTQTPITAGVQPTQPSTPTTAAPAAPPSEGVPGSLPTANLLIIGLGVIVAGGGTVLLLSRKK